MFRDRKDGGQQLGRALEKYRYKNVLVLGIPRGGVETAYYVARHLHAELSVIVTRKLGFPSHPETAFGAIAEDGSVFLFDTVTEMLSEKNIQSVVERELEETRRRIQTFRGGQPLPSMKGRTVILVDDGIATGATVFASIRLCKNRGAKKIIVATPVAGGSMISKLKTKVDEVLVLYAPDDYYAVSQAYLSFSDLEDNEVMEILKHYQAERSTSNVIY